MNWNIDIFVSLLDLFLYLQNISKSPSEVWSNELLRVLEVVQEEFSSLLRLYCKVRDQHIFTLCSSFVKIIKEAFSEIIFSEYEIRTVKYETIVISWSNLLFKSVPGSNYDSAALTKTPSDKFDIFAWIKLLIIIVLSLLEKGSCILVHALNGWYLTSHSFTVAEPKTVEANHIIALSCIYSS